MAVPDRTWDLICRHFDDGVVRVHPMAPEGEVPTPALLAAIGTRIGVIFPNEYVAHVCGRFPGVAVEVREERWPRPEEYEVAPLWHFLYSVFTYTPIVASEDWMRVDVAALKLREETGLVAAPVLEVPSAPDLVCIDAEGALCRWRRATRELERLDQTFWEVFDEELAGLAKRARERFAALRAGPGEPR